MRLPLFGAAAAAFLLCGCLGSVDIKEDKIQPRAAYDLDCPEGEVDVERISGTKTRGTYGAEGCDKRARYEAVCTYSGTCTIDVESMAE